MYKTGFLHRFVSEWIPAYLFYCGLLAHFAAVLLVVATALKPAPRRELERIGHKLLEPLDNSAGCTEVFQGAPFDWENPRSFRLASEPAPGVRVLPIYKSLGLRGTTGGGNDIFQVAVELDIQDEVGHRTAVQPLGQTFFEVNQKNGIERCHVKLNEDRAFDCMLERGQAQSSGDCLIPVKDKSQCTALQGTSESPNLCRIQASQPIPKRAATEALAQTEKRSEPCEQPGWFRTVTCAEGGRRCRPSTLCEPRGGN